MSLLSVHDCGMTHWLPLLASVLNRKYTCHFNLLQRGRLVKNSRILHGVTASCRLLARRSLSLHSSTPPLRCHFLHFIRIPFVHGELRLKLYPVAKTNSLALPTNNWRKTKDAFLFDNEVERWSLNFFYGLSNALITGFMAKFRL